jgi:hypothetical protein
MNAQRGAPRTRNTTPLLSFIGRASKVSTNDVAFHFQWTMKRAERELEELRDEGLIESWRVWRVNYWRLTPLGIGAL